MVATSILLDWSLALWTLADPGSIKVWLLAIIICSVAVRFPGMLAHEAHGRSPAPFFVGHSDAARLGTLQHLVLGIADEALPLLKILPEVAQGGTHGRRILESHLVGASRRVNAGEVVLQ